MMAKAKTTTPETVEATADRMLELHALLTTKEYAFRYAISTATGLTSDYEIDDIYAYACDEALKRCGTYESRNGASLETWFRVVLRNATIRYGQLPATRARFLELPRENAWRTLSVDCGPYEEANPLDSHLVDMLDDPQDPEEAAMAKEFLATIAVEFTKRCRDAITPDEAALLRETRGLDNLRGMNDAEKRALAAKLGQTYDFVRRGITHIPNRVMSVAKAFVAQRRFGDFQEAQAALEAFNLSFES